MVKWPNGWTRPDNLGNSVLSSDPNEHFREWLESNVGKQGWDWDWRVGPTSSPDEVWIKFRKPHADAAMLFQLTYS